MRPGADEDVTRCRRIANADDLELPSGHRVADRLDPDEAMRADPLEQALQVRQSIGFHARNMQARRGHGHAQLHPVTGQTIRRHGPPRLPVVGDRNRLQLAGDRTGLAVPHVVQIAELERERRARASVQHEMHVTGSAVRRRAFVVVNQIDSDDVADDLVPQRRAVLDAGVDELERGCRLLLGATRQRGFGQRADQRGVRRNGVSNHLSMHPLSGSCELRRRHQE